MTAGHVRDLPPAKRRQLIFWAVLRSVLIAAVLVVLYYVLPLDRRWDSDTAARLLIGLLIFAGVVVWGIRTIAGSRYPGVRMHLMFPAPGHPPWQPGPPILPPRTRAASATVRANSEKAARTVAPATPPGVTAAPC